MATTNRGKEKRVPSWNSQSKKSSSTADKASSASASASASCPDEQQVPNYLKPTISSRLEPHQRSFQLRSHNISKPNLDRRRSFDRPPSLKQSSLSSSRLHKALVSPGPRERTVSRRVSSSSSLSAKSSSSASSKPISKTSVRDGKLHHKVSSTSSKTSTSSRNKQQPSSANSSTKAPKRNINVKTIEKTLNVDHPQEIKEAPSHDSIVDETPELVNSEHDDDDYEPQIKADNDDVIPTESEELKTDPGVEEEKEQETTEKAEEEKPTETNDIEHQVEENVNQEEKSNDMISHPQEISATEVESVEVKEKEKAEEEEKHHETPPVDENSHRDAKEEKQVTEKGDERASEEFDLKENVKGEGDERASEEVDLKENVKGEGDERASEEVDLNVNVKGEGDDDHQVENSVTEEGSKNDETTKNESTATRKQIDTDSGGKGKESPQAYNDVIEETKNKLMGARKNKVSALVGAFQTVIGHESSSK